MTQGMGRGLGRNELELLAIAFLLVWPELIRDLADSI